MAERGCSPVPGRGPLTTPAPLWLERLFVFPFPYCEKKLVLQCRKEVGNGCHRGSIFALQKVIIRATTHEVLTVRSELMKLLIF